MIALNPDMNFIPTLPSLLCTLGPLRCITKFVNFFFFAGYHIIYIYRATKGQRGYNFESIPSFQ